MTARLQKTADEVSPLIKLHRRLEAFLQRHAFFFLVISIMVLFALILCLIYAVFGASFTGTEANAYYYHMEDII